MLKILITMLPFLLLSEVVLAEADFSRDVRPILAQHCFKCHGPDVQEGGLRLDRRDSTLKPSDSEKVAIVPGEPDSSELMRRVLSDDEDTAMPPRNGSNLPLTPSQIKTLRDWIADGAKYKIHWAYQKPLKMDTPDNMSAIDYFVRKRLQQENLTPSPPASFETLCRRLYLDLVGLPPSPEDVDAFLKAANQDRELATVAIVEKLLDSPRFGEKWARHWLDLARYGDSAGYQHDDDMPLWSYRDWVIQAFNADMPFDQFTIEQIAGDLLPNASLAQRVATGFHRGATVTLGADQNVEELRAQLIWDRVNTLGTTWLATSLECAQCHTHKFDPISQTEYYQMYAYFNRTVPDLSKEVGSHYFITGGVMELPGDKVQHAKFQQLITEMSEEIAKMLEIKVNLDTAGAPLRRIYTGPNTARHPERTYYYLTDELKGPGPKEIATNIANLRALGQELMGVLPPRVLVLEEDLAPPVTHVMLRGNVRTLGEKVIPGTLSALHKLPDGAPPNRLGLAQWIVSRENPLTARVMVNRWWAELFGSGLVTTPEDFGLQGESPSHPDLLDWLAVDLMEQGWSMKQILKKIVLSETYQQQSVFTVEGLERDLPNRWLSRGPRHRLDAELLRDNALTIAGVLQHELGGKPAYATRAEAFKSKGEFTWRRGIYVRQKRGEPYATFASFDSPDRFACSARRSRTNTPLQALALLNEPIFMEAAMALAKRVMREIPDPDSHQRLSRMFLICTARKPKDWEQVILDELFEKSTRDGTNELEALRLVANALLNLDETMTKE